MKLYEDNIQKIIVFRALQLGDMLCAVPAFRALRKAFPDGEITLTGLPWAATFVDRFNQYFDYFIPFPGYPGLPEQPCDARVFTKFLGQVQQQRFDLALQMQGNGSVVNPMVELFAARFTAGYRTAGHYYPSNGLFIEYPDFGSEIHRHLLLMQSLGITDVNEQLEFPVTTADEEALAKVGLNITAKQYVCIHPGSRGDWRQWPVKHFAAVADYCFEKALQPVITGTSDEMPIAEGVAAHMKHPPVIAAGKTSVGAMAALIRDARLLVSNCTGVSHIAAALKTASVVLSMDNEPERWGPVNKKLHTTIDWLREPDFEKVFMAVKAKISGL